MNRLVRTIRAQRGNLDNYKSPKDSTSESSEMELETVEDKNKAIDGDLNYCYALFFELEDQSERVDLVRRLCRRLKKAAKMKLTFYRSYFTSKDSDGTSLSKYLICLIGMSEYDLRQ